MPLALPAAEVLTRNDACPDHRAVAPFAAADETIDVDGSSGVVLERWPAPKAEPVDRTRMLAMREQYGELIDQLVGIFAETTPDALAALDSARERDDAESIRGAAHSLKGACQNVGATVMTELCRALEANPASAATTLDARRAAFEPTLAALRDVAA